MINDGNLLRCEGSWWGYAVNYYNSEAKKLNLVPVTSVDITLNAAGDGKSYATAYLPFAVSEVSGAKAYTATEPVNNAIELTEATEGVAAKQGIVLISDEAAETATLTIGEGTAESALQGTTVAQTVEAGSVLTLGRSKEDGTVGFFAFTGTGLRANSAYLSAESANGAAAVLFSFGGESDGIQGVESVNAAAQGKVFDLSGRRVSRAGRGIYIVNGKKIVK